MNVLFLSNNLEVTKPLYDWLCETENPENVHIWDAPLTVELLNSDTLSAIEFVVSYNYRYIINRNIIEMFPKKIINLHISLLPWNRVASPNVWSFIEDTPKGVTIHHVDKGLDTGDILFQRQIFFDEDVETLATSYNKLHVEIQQLFQENWEAIKNGCVRPKKQIMNHTKEETNELMHIYNIDWDETIQSLKQKISCQLETFTPPPPKIIEANKIWLVANAAA